MWKIILAISVFLGLFSIVCENKVATQKENTSVVAESPSIISNQENLPDNSVKSQANDYLNKGLKYQAEGEYEKAIQEFVKSIKSGNEDKEMYRRVAELSLALKKYEDTEIYLRKILEKDLNDVRANWSLATILVWNLGKYKEGLAIALKSKELDKSDTSYVMDKTIGKAYDSLGDIENALKHYKLFLKGSSFIPDSTDYKEVKKRVLELEKK